ncbi:MAG: hypothetical protein HC896_04610 [Bacteroidales bacterium]|nr:hypothetical protein [Bacteroidales bacterium]
MRAKWRGTQKEGQYVAQIHVTGIDEFGIFNQISETITSELKATLRSINLDTNDGMFEGTIKVMVKDKVQLQGILHKLSQIKGVLRAHRTG